MDIFYFASIRLGQANAANRHVLEVCNQLAERGHRIHLFVPFRRSPLVALHHRVEIVPVPVVYGFSLLLTTLSFYFALPWWAAGHFARVHPDVVYTRMTFLDWLAIVPLRVFFRFSYVPEVNGIRSMEAGGSAVKRWLIAWQEKITLRLSDKVIGVAPELCQWIVETGNLGPEQTVAIGNGVSTDVFQPMPAQHAQEALGLDVGLRYLTFVSSLTPWHDTSTLIQAMPRLLSEFPNVVRLLIVGDGPEKDHLVDLAQKLGVDHAIDWVGWVSSDRVPLYINASEICLAPFPAGRDYFSAIKVYEYMGCGRPYVTTRLGATFDDQLESCQCGVFVAPGDASALAEAVVDLLRDPEQRERLGRRGREVAVERYSWSRIAEQIERFIMSSDRTVDGAGSPL
jgi:glycosyltransferase involved in cell wall biosynthesis